ncbi:hypothetical protein BTM_6124 (plasmid) [Burkholderia thailandensis 34]|uniref:hypothetical protein n=1 Tax=Burkholderia thailandensis TaxID=57975 RepID=UPI000698CED5|nr:hypothetical protein [Burkholderia thailandensis]AJY27226.1 hypothetical protein BTM_6124 [Burkholderia thailandensis 34]AOJ58514.1 penicillin-binding protein activator LpoB [Burkholderia thailandensis]KXF59788.1 penicillin-binding protein activator LpoB [Burkholderia thailandensis]PNE73163.1 penicillin-binding protein activator LpoB [Burkholderia thailandensis]
MDSIKKVARTSRLCLIAVALTCVASACGTMQRTAAPTLAYSDRIAVAAVANYTETPDAGRSAESIAAGALRAGGLDDVRVAPAESEGGAMFDAARRVDAAHALDWARSQDVRYVLSGAVEEWRYKTGVDGEPVVGVTFELLDVSSGTVVWSAVGSRTGWSRSGLSSVATKLIADVLSPLRPRR